MTLTEKFVALKTRVGGNREQRGYEETFGMPREEQWRITPPAPFQRRILAELEFAIRLSDSLSGRFDDEVGAALDIALAAVDADGALTRPAAEAAEAALMPLSDAAKEYTLIFAGHAHIDMNWMWPWHETVASTLATFRTMLDIMDEYPEFRFSQSQASVYRIAEEFDPELAERIKARIREGRWEITASAWVETDKNMPNGESLLRHIKYTKNYLRDNWGVDPTSLEIDFSPDTFGHSFNVPEIDAQGGVKYYYHCRALDGKQALYRWVGASGAELLCYREQYWYNSGVTPKPAIGLIDVARRQGGLKTGLAVYGVGDHGGGPTRRDIERVLDMMKWPVFPRVKFGTFREFFALAETVRDALPVVNHELNAFAPGCFTTQSRIKRGNRACEAALTDAEGLSALAAFKAGLNPRSDALELAWRNVLFTHFHDILTGSCVQDTREHAMGLYSDSLAVANTASERAMRVIADATDTSSLGAETNENSQSEGAGAGYGVAFGGGKPAPERGGGKTRIFTVFNPVGAERDDMVELTVWDWTGDMRRVAVTDGDGAPLPFQMLDGDLQQYWDHKYFRVLVRVKLGAYAYTTVVLRERAIEGLYPVYYQGDHRTDGENRDFVLENEYIRAVFSVKNGALLSMTDKETGRETVRPGAHAGFVEIDTERSSSDAWHIGKYLAINPVTKVTNIRWSVGGMRRGFYFESHTLGSTLRTTVTLDDGARFVRYKTTVDWNESAGETVPVLAFALPVNADVKEYVYDIPAGVIRRAPFEQDVPGCSYGAAETDGLLAYIANTNKYGYRGCADGTLISTLINSAAYPDPYPERGVHELNFAVGVLPDCAKLAADTAALVARPMCYTSTKSHGGTLPLSGSLADIEADGCVVSSAAYVDGALEVRVFSVSEVMRTVTIGAPSPVKSAAFVGLMEDGRGEVDVKDGKAVFEVGPAQIKTVRLTF